MSDPRPLLGVSACLLVPPDRVVLVKRGKAPFRGLFSLPGGRVEFAERLEDAVRRELSEETGLSIGGLRFLTVHEIVDRPKAIHAVIAVFHGRLTDGEAARISAAGDVDEARIVRLDELRELASSGKTTEGLLAIVEQALALQPDVLQASRITL